MPTLKVSAARFRHRVIARALLKHVDKPRLFASAAAELGIRRTWLYILIHRSPPLTQLAERLKKRRRQLRRLARSA